ncbi:flagellar motor switch protein FliM [Verticiella sediminum]|uniref:Flagellar motor switch protein FliM n=1 Tax=Verticiella sediminum TaxID=1247510 RepID=A0A556ARX2_9BURK|nr:flagellar motor switch protein FliM [Verticiella sediminum]TSH95666.1 flagellar motor switch protein FliM [Verticiella sediminum]
MATYEAMLSQQEVDALLANVNGDEGAGAGQAEREGDIRPYDLTSPERIVRRRMHALEAINEHFARNMRAALLNFMRRSADITVGTIKVQKYSDFERNLPVPSNLNLVNMKPLRGTALFTFDPNLVFLIIDSLFGGDGRYHTRVEGRDFTVTEQRIIRRVLNLTLDCYGKAWNPVYPVGFEYLRAEMHTKFASVTGPNEVVVTTTFRIEFGATGGELNICLPYSMIEPVRDLLTRPLQQSSLEAVDQRWSQLLTDQVRGADVELVAEFTCIDTTIAELLKLRAGDVLPIELPQHVTARADGVPVMQCTYGASRGHYALRVQTLDGNEPAAPSFQKPEQAKHD